MPNRSQFATNEEYNAYMRSYRANNREKMRVYNRLYNSEWRKKNGYHNEDKWKVNNDIALKAQQKLRYAVKTGAIKKLPCTICNRPNAVAHHPDYSRPLEVIWLCRLHHRAVHYGNK